MNAIRSTQPADLFLDRLLDLEGPHARAVFERAVLMTLLEDAPEGLSRSALATGLRRVQERIAAGECVHCGSLPGNRHRWGCRELLAAQSATSPRRPTDRYTVDRRALDPTAAFPSQRAEAPTSPLPIAAWDAALQVEQRRAQLRREARFARWFGWVRWFSW